MIKKVKYLPGESIQGFINDTWYVGLVLDHNDYVFDNLNIPWEIEYGEKVFASFPEFLKGKPIVINITTVMRVTSDIGKILYD